MKTTVGTRAAVLCWVGEPLHALVGLPARACAPLPLQAHHGTHSELEALRVAHGELTDAEALARQQLRALHARLELERTQEEAA